MHLKDSAKVPRPQPYIKKQKNLGLDALFVFQKILRTSTYGGVLSGFLLNNNLCENTMKGASVK